MHVFQGRQKVSTMYGYRFIHIKRVYKRCRKVSSVSIYPKVVQYHFQILRCLYSSSVVNRLNQTYSVISCFLGFFFFVCLFFVVFLFFFFFFFFLFCLFFYLLGLRYSITDS